ncbi:L,D-transpeptidase [Paraburkholderia sp.]|uniref:L,D-transpeptidase n=1 Tax=Paraburkholderia sp. TaxID=1926495 RepID=UPI0025F0F42D|nr:L,D-transpeptidase [Paraburkholderia sp.]
MNADIWPGSPTQLQQLRVRRSSFARRVLCAAACVWWAAGAALVAGATPASAAHVASGAVQAANGLATSAASAARTASAPASAPLPATPATAPSGNAASVGAPASTPAPASAPAVLKLPEHPALTRAQDVEETHAALRMRAVFAREVTRRLRVPLADQHAYGARLQAALDDHDLGELASEFVVLVDRNANVQALFIYFRAAPGEPWLMIGASPVATGRPGEFDHFLTPLGVFEHTPANMDFRAEGTMNQNGIRGYGRRDMRIYDLGWVDGERGWGKGGVSQMRFQMHATDPDRLEPLLGIRHSKGCVRIPASLNVFLDHHGIIDAEYEALAASGRSLWVLHSDRVVTPWAGRFIVVVDSERKTRPAWSPAPGSKARAKVPAGGDQAD